MNISPFGSFESVNILHFNFSKIIKPCLPYLAQSIHKWGFRFIQMKDFSLLQGELRVKWVKCFVWILKILSSTTTWSTSTKFGTKHDKIVSNLFSEGTEHFFFTIEAKSKIIKISFQLLKIFPRASGQF